MPVLAEDGGRAVSQDLGANDYLSVGELKYVVVDNKNATMNVNVTNTDSRTHAFALSAETRNAYLSFTVGLIPLLVEYDNGVYVHKFPQNYTLVSGESASISLFLESALPVGFVYMLTCFDVILYIDASEHVGEWETVRFLVTEDYDTLSSFNMTNHADLSSEVSYEFSRNPVDVYSNSTLTVRVLNNSTDSHNYSIRVTDRAGRIRVFKGEDEYQTQDGPWGPYIIVPVGTVLPYNSHQVPIKLSGILIPGCMWARYMVEISVLIDNETTLTKTLGLDVGTALSDSAQFSDLIFSFSGDTCEISLKSDRTDIGDGSFILMLPFEDIVILLEPYIPYMLQAIVTKAILPALFTNLPTVGCSAAVVGFLSWAATGLIIEGIRMVVTGDNTGLVYIAAGGAILILIVVICVFRARND